MDIFVTSGAVLEIGGPIVPPETATEATFAGQTWLVIGEPENLGKGGDTSEAVAFQSITRGRARELKGPRSGGTREVVCGRVERNPGQEAAIAAEKTHHDYAFRLTLNNAPPVKSATATITIASPGVVTWAGHGLPANTPVVLATTGTLPTGLVAGTTYYVKEVLTENTFTLSATPGGTVINTSSTQSGTHTITTQPVGGRRLFAAQVGSAEEVLDAAANVVKLALGLRVSTNLVAVLALG